MSYNTDKQCITKSNLDDYLKEVAKEFRKRNGKTMPAEIIIIGGASVLINYGFRDSTLDINAIIHASGAMKEAINLIGDKYDLPNNWLNSDFMTTTSYSDKLIEVSKYYRTFSNIVQIRTVDAQYLVAMKLKSGRRYKNDFSDIVGILCEHDKKGNPIILNDIVQAVEKLYSSWDNLSEDSQNFIQGAMKDKKYLEIYSKIREDEVENKSIMIDFDKKYPNELNESNLEDILKTLKQRSKESKK